MNEFTGVWGVACPETGVIHCNDVDNVKRRTRPVVFWEAELAEKKANDLTVAASRRGTSEVYLPFFIPFQETVIVQGRQT